MAGDHAPRGARGRLPQPPDPVLIRMRLLERVVPITEKNPGASKRALYRISDPYLDFWYRFVSPMVSGGMIGLTRGEALWKHQVSPRLDDYMGPLFEEVCRAFVGRGEDLPFVPLRVGEWWDADSRNQIDVVALGPAGEVLLGECKWGTVRAADVERLRSRAERVRRELSGARDTWLAVFSARGVADEVETEIAAGRLLHVSAERLYGL